MKKDKFKWYVVNKEYINYLRKFDDKVECIEYNNSLKPYIGIVIKIDNYNYYVPVSSPKNKHYNMKDDIDFFRIMKNNKIYGVLNINNMVPIIEGEVKELKYNEIDKYRNFNLKKEKISYISLLNLELKLINMNLDRIQSNAIKLYNEKSNNPNSKISNRCCDFKLLEEKSKLFEDFFVCV